MTAFPPVLGACNFLLGLFVVQKAPKAPGFDKPYRTSLNARQEKPRYF